jgi:hypothetical protein
MSRGSRRNTFRAHWTAVCTVAKPIRGSTRRPGHEHGLTPLLDQLEAMGRSALRAAPKLAMAIRWWIHPPRIADLIEAKDRVFGLVKQRLRVVNSGYSRAARIVVSWHSCGCVREPIEAWAPVRAR